MSPTLKKVLELEMSVAKDTSVSNILVSLGPGKWPSFTLSTVSMHVKWQMVRFWILLTTFCTKNVMRTLNAKDRRITILLRAMSHTVSTYEVSDLEVGDISKR